MNYCEKCSCATQDDQCPLCGTKKLRPVREDDYCFLTECEKSYAAERKRVLAAEGIEAVGVPYGNGFLTQVALPLENERLYVRFPDLERAIGLLKQERNERDDAYLSYVRSRTDDLFVPAKLAKKLCRKLHLAEDELVPFLAREIAASDAVFDGGRIGMEEARMYLCRSERFVVTVNSDTFEVLAVDRRKRPRF